MKKLYNLIMPKIIKDCIWDLKDYITDTQKRNIIKFLKSNIEHQNQEKLEILNYLRHNRKNVFPYYFTKKYHSEHITVYMDDDSDMKYVLHENKRMYFPISWDIEKIQSYYNSLLIEQDIDSPHRYEYSDFCVNYGDVVADVGAAEGIFSLSIIEKAKKVYLFEGNEIWINPLQMTFEPYRDKIITVNNFISDASDNNSISLDDFFIDKDINFLKVDIEGSELKLLMGAKSILSKRRNLKIVLCTYHKHNDEHIFSDLLIKNGFKINFSKGYMLFMEDTELTRPYLRRGLIRAQKN
jgi:hypothetical protein